MGAVAKHIFLVTDPERLEETVRSAFELARTGRPGPVVIDIPKDIQFMSGTYKGVSNSRHKSYVPPQQGDQKAIDAAVELEGESINGVLLPVGGGSVAIIGERNEELESIRKNVMKSVTWST